MQYSLSDKIRRYSKPVTSVLAGSLLAANLALAKPEIGEINVKPLPDKNVFELYVEAKEEEGKPATKLLAYDPDKEEMITKSELPEKKDNKKFFWLRVPYDYAEKQVYLLLDDGPNSATDRDTQSYTLPSIPTTATEIYGSEISASPLEESAVSATYLAESETTATELSESEDSATKLADSKEPDKKKSKPKKKGFLKRIYGKTDFYSASEADVLNGGFNSSSNTNQGGKTLNVAQNGSPMILRGELEAGAQYPLGKNYSGIIFVYGDIDKMDGTLDNIANGKNVGEITGLPTRYSAQGGLGVGLNLKNFKHSLRASGGLESFVQDSDITYDISEVNESINASGTGIRVVYAMKDKEGNGVELEALLKSVQDPSSKSQSRVPMYGVVNPEITQPFKKDKYLLILEGHIPKGFLVKLKGGKVSRKVGNPGSKRATGYTFVGLEGGWKPFDPVKLIKEKKWVPQKYIALVGGIEKVLDGTSELEDAADVNVSTLSQKHTYFGIRTYPLPIMNEIGKGLNEIGKGFGYVGNQIGGFFSGLFGSKKTPKKTVDKPKAEKQIEEPESKEIEKPKAEKKEAKESAEKAKPALGDAEKPIDVGESTEDEGSVDASEFENAEPAKVK